MNSKRKAFTSILYSVLVTVLVIEGGMRLFGWGYLYLQEKQNRTDLTNSQDIVVLAIGESTTAFGGTDSWPNQLERLLNSLQNIKKFHVINRGVPATNTNEILNRLPEYLDKYKPNFVLAMVGANDKFTDKTSSTPQSASKGINWESEFQKIRVYKLMQWIWNGISSQKKATSKDEVEATFPGSQNLLVDENLSNDLREIYSSQTVSNLNSMVTISERAGARLIFVQYAFAKLDFLRSAIQGDVLYISNYSVFKRALDKYEYDDLFVDKAVGFFGHATKFGNRILAENVAQGLLKIVTTE